MNSITGLLVEDFWFCLYKVHLEMVMYCGIVGYPFGLPPYVLMVGNLLLSISYHAHGEHISLFRHDIIRDMSAPRELM